MPRVPRVPQGARVPRVIPRLLLADRVKGPRDSFLVPLLPALRQRYDVRLVSLPPGDALARAIEDADIVWLEWCWDHAVWATGSGALRGKPCIVRLHSIEALQTDFPARVDWAQVTHLITVADDITALLLERFPAMAGAVPISIVPNGIDLRRFAAGEPDRHKIAWVGHVEPKKNPMLLLHIAQALHRRDTRFTFHAAGACTDLRTLRYIQRMVPALGLNGVIRFYGPVDDMPAWYADKGVLLSTSMYESFGMNIGEAMAVGAFPVVHDFPGAGHLWPAECLFSGIDEAVALMLSARPGLYRDWVAGRYALERQEAAMLRILDQAASGTRTVQPSPARA